MGDRTTGIPRDSGAFENHYEFKELLNTLYEKEWIVYTKQAFNGAQSVINYLGRYTHRIAISNRRIERIDGDNVIYKVKDYKNGGGMISTSVREMNSYGCFLCTFYLRDL